jgi:NAD+ kinase
MKNLVVIPNVNKDMGFTVTNEVVGKLLSLGFNVYVHSDVGYTVDGINLYSELPECIDLMVVIGGDGSVIDASGLAVERDIPVLGVNLGRMGYLTEVELDEISELDNIASGEYSVTEKMLLCVDFPELGGACERYAVNDVTVSRDSFLHIADIKIEDSIQNSVKIRADGVILSTPQGSTAYSFSAGGPILAHDVEGILLTPVSPHSFFNRSVLFNASDVLKITNVGSLPLNVSVDGRNVGSIATGEQCNIRRAPKNIKILTFKKNSMFSSLFKKMRILGDIN